MACRIIFTIIHENNRKYYSFLNKKRKIYQYFPIFRMFNSEFWY